MGSKSHPRLIQRTRNSSGQEPQRRGAFRRWVVCLDKCIFLPGAHPGRETLAPETLGVVKRRRMTRSTLRRWSSISVVTDRPYHAGILMRGHLKPLDSKLGVSRLGWCTFRYTFRS